MGGKKSSFNYDWNRKQKGAENFGVVDDGG